MPFPVPDPFVWDASFQVFYFNLDDQHRAIFEGMFNCTNDNSPSNLQILYLVTANHFAHEEGCMVDAGYSGYGSHKGAHEAFLAKMRSFSAPISKDDLYYCKDWLVQHIKNIDFKYKQKL